MTQNTSENSLPKYYAFTLNKGTGLGLSYDIISKAYRGQLSVESQGGKETAFWVQLPR